MNSTNETIVVVARLRGKSGCEDQLDAALKSLLEPSRADEGCLIYDMHRRLDDDGNKAGGEWLFHEQWTSRSALDAHLQRPHMKAFFDKAPDMVDGDVDITIWSKAR